MPFAATVSSDTDDPKEEYNGYNIPDGPPKMLPDTEMTNEEPSADKNIESITTKPPYTFGEDLVENTASDDDLIRNLEDYPNEEKLEEVVRILSWPDFAYYEILGVGKNASRNDMAKQYRKKASLTHTDKNKDPQAKDAFSRLAKAWAVLSDESERRKYDRERIVLEEKKLIVQDVGTSQRFEKGAFEESGDSEDSDEEDEEPPIDPKRKKIHGKMTPYVQMVLENPKDEEAFRKLEALNKKIGALNQKEYSIMWANLHMVPVFAIRETAIQGKPWLDALRKNPNKLEARKRIEALNIDLQRKWNAAGFPQDWIFRLPENLNYQENNKASGQKDEASSKGSEGSKSHQNRSSSSRGGTSSSKNDVPESSSSPTSMDIDPPTELPPTELPPRRDDWRPGETEWGEKILAYRPITKWVRQKSNGQWIESELVEDWVIETPSKKRIALVSSERVGLAAVEAYLSLPEAEKNSLNKIDQKYDRRNGAYIRAVLGFDCKESANAGILPYSVVLIDYNGEERIVNRTAIRKARPRDADKMIDDFLFRIGQRPRWPPKHVRMQQRIENTRNKLLIEEAAEKARRDVERIGKRSTGSTYSDSAYSTGPSDSEDLFVRSRDSIHRLRKTGLLSDQSDSDRRKFSRGHAHRKGRRNEVELNKSRETSERRNREDQQPMNDHVSETNRGNDVITRSELESMMQQMMDHMLVQFQGLKAA